MNLNPSPTNDIILRFTWPAELLETINGLRTAVILLAERLSEFEFSMIASGRAVSLAKNHVELFALIGDDAEQSHDSLDVVLETSGNNSVVTTFHAKDELEDVAALVAASAQVTGLEQILVVVDPASELGVRLGEFLDDHLPKRTS